MEHAPFYPMRPPEPMPRARRSRNSDDPGSSRGVLGDAEPRAHSLFSQPRRRAYRTMSARVLSESFSMARAR